MTFEKYLGFENYVFPWFLPFQMAPFFPFFVRILVAPSCVFQKLPFCQGTSPQFGNGPHSTNAKKADKKIR